MRKKKWIATRRVCTEGDMKSARQRPSRTVRNQKYQLIFEEFAHKVVRMSGRSFTRLSSLCRNGQNARWSRYSIRDRGSEDNLQIAGGFIGLQLIADRVHQLRIAEKLSGGLGAVGI